jgi:hypothetical protein
MQPDCHGERNEAISNCRSLVCWGLLRAATRFSQSPRANPVAGDWWMSG